MGLCCVLVETLSLISFSSFTEFVLFEKMEITAVDSVAGVEVLVDIDASSTVAHMEDVLKLALGYNEAVTLELDGTLLEQTALPVSSLALTSGSKVVVTPTGEKYLDVLRADPNAHREVPLYALNTRAAAVAVASTTHDLRKVNPLFWGDEEVVFSCMELTSPPRGMNTKQSLQAKLAQMLSLQYASSELRNNKAFVCTLFKNTDCLYGASDALKRDKDVVFASFQSSQATSYLHASEEVQMDRDVAKAAATGGFADVHLCHANDVDIAVANQSNLHTRVLGELVRNDPYAIASLITKAHHPMEVLKQCSTELRNDVEFALECTPFCKGGILGVFGEDVRADPEAVRKAVGAHASNLKYANEGARADSEVVMCAARLDPNSLSFADSSFRRNKDVLKEAMRTDASTLMLSRHASEQPSQCPYIPADMWGDKEIVLQAVNMHGSNYVFASEALQRDADVAMAALATFCHIHPCHWNNKTVAIRAAELGKVHCIGDKLRGDAEVMLAACAHPHVLSYAHTELHNDTAFALQCVVEKGVPLKYLGDVPRQDKDVVVHAVRSAAQNLQHAGRALRGDRDVVMAAVLRDGMSLRFASEELRGDIDVIRCAVDPLSGQNFEFASVAAQLDKEVFLALLPTVAFREAYIAPFATDRECVLACVKRGLLGLAEVRVDFRGDPDIVEHFSQTTPPPPLPIPPLPSTAAQFGFGATPGIAAGGFGGFGASTSNTTASSGFGATPSTGNGAAGFGGFGATPGTNNATSSSGFGATPSTGKTTAGFGGFGASTSNTTASSGFGATPSTGNGAAGFGGFGATPGTNNTTASSGFGATPGTGNTTAGFGGFGASTNNATSSSGFGATPSTGNGAAGFGGFGARTNTSNTTASSGFGATPSTGNTTTGFGFGGFAAATNTNNAAAGFGGFGAAPAVVGTTAAETDGFATPVGKYFKVPAPSPPTDEQRLFGGGGFGGGGFAFGASCPCCRVTSALATGFGGFGHASFGASQPSGFFGGGFGAPRENFESVLEQLRKAN